MLSKVELRYLQKGIKLATSKFFPFDWDAKKKVVVETNSEFKKFTRYLIPTMYVISCAILAYGFLAYKNLQDVVSLKFPVHLIMIASQSFLTAILFNGGMDGVRDYQALMNHLFFEGASGNTK